MSGDNHNLYALASEVGVLTSYHDWKGNRREARPDVLLRVLQLLGLELERVADAHDAARRHAERLWAALAPSFAVAWDGHALELGLRVRAGDTGPYTAQLTLASGETRRHEGRLSDLAEAEHADVGGAHRVRRALRVPVGELGYHRLVVEAAGQRSECDVIAAPTAAYRGPSGKRWGLFAPLYAVHREAGGGAGDLGDMMRLSRWTRDLGGEFVGTLPLLSAFLSQPCEASPYAPVSRMFWNELYVNPATAPGIEGSARARQLLASPAFAAEAATLRALELVDYRGQMAHKRAVLEALADSAWQSDALQRELHAYMARTPRADDYARFRAVTEARGQLWWDWPEPLRSGTVADGDFDDRVRRYHLYVQYAMEAQLSRMEAEGAASLYLDLPVGVHRGGYDVWRDREVFVLGAAAGAPPDPLFSSGQNWGLPPLHPYALRDHGYRYFIDCIRHHMRHAGLLRVDHVMGMHRLYWIPEDVDTRDGIYVHYDAGDMYAIISLESHRHGCAVIGEDLGTVPDYVRPSMQHHGMSRLYVAQFSLPGGAPGEHEVAPPPAASIASLNTHDTPTFSGYWHGRDIDDFLALGVITAEEAARDHATRRATCEATARFLAERGYLASPGKSGHDLEAITRGLMEYLAASDAEMVMVNLEDLWLEPLPHNVPGTCEERPNWRRKMRYSLDNVVASDDLVGFLRRVDTIRRGGC